MRRAPELAPRLHNSKRSPPLAFKSKLALPCWVLELAPRLHNSKLSPRVCITVNLHCQTTSPGFGWLTFNNDNDTSNNTSNNDNANSNDNNIN